MEYIRNNLSATKSAESTDLIALLQQLQFRLNSAQTTQQLGHELLDALVQALLHETPNRLIQRIRRRRSQHTKPTDRMTREQAQSDLETVRDLRTLARQKDVFRGHRKLDPYRQEIIQLHQVGASQHEIRFWLYREKRCRVAQSTICKYLKDIGAYGATTRL